MVPGIEGGRRDDPDGADGADGAVGGTDSPGIATLVGGGLGPDVWDGYAGHAATVDLAEDDLTSEASLWSGRAAGRPLMGKSMSRKSRGSPVYRSEGAAGNTRLDGKAL